MLGGAYAASEQAADGLVERSTVDKNAADGILKGLLSGSNMGEAFAQRAWQVALACEGQGRLDRARLFYGIVAQSGTSLAAEARSKLSTAASRPAIPESRPAEVMGY